MSRRLVKKPIVRNDLLEIFVAIAQDNVQAAERVLAAVEETFERLREMPGIGRRWESDSPRTADLRVTTIPKYRNYLVFYRALPDAVEIVRVLHGARDIARIIERETT